MTDREQAAIERAQFEEQLVAARATLAQRQQEEDETRQNVARSARVLLDDAERAASRAAGSRATRGDRPRARAPRERRAVAARRTVDARAGQLGDALQLDRARARERRRCRGGSAHARGGGSGQRSRPREPPIARRATVRLRRARSCSAPTRFTRRFRARSTRSMRSSANASVSLRRPRACCASASSSARARVLGPLSDFISADQASALLVERFLGATVHAVLVRDRAVAEAVRSWHATANPGPLLLLPLDALREDNNGGDEGAEALSHRVDAAGPGRRWVRALLGHAQPVDDGAAFIDARGAVWLPGSISRARTAAAARRALRASR